MKKYLFVCLGNICRSPAAHGIMEKMAREKGIAECVDVDSAGTYGGHSGELPDTRMREAASKRGYDLTHRARQFTRADFERFDHIIVMDDSNYERVCRLAPDMQSLSKVERMTDYCTRFDIDHVPDPYYQGQSGFEYVLDILEDAVSNLIERTAE
ncbi:MAG: low molecular weight phosphotyrosine protein phosphatase [Rikenellaceae bacterium]|nr:low molecular weight phosphotyrosine protein phosphatase [Rikenellaceae bacterium]